MKERVTRWALAAAAVAVVAHAAAGVAIAGFAVAVPEINPGSISAGLAVLAGGILMLRARRKSK